jgi:hypothetical protein
MRWRSGVIDQSSANDPDRVVSSVVDAQKKTGNLVLPRSYSLRLGLN